MGGGLDGTCKSGSGSGGEKVRKKKEDVLMKFSLLGNCVKRMNLFQIHNRRLEVWNITT